jgi:hypothetical protein
VIVFLGVGVLAGEDARAQTSPAPPARDPAAAQWLFRDGRALMKKGDFPAACAKLEESQRLDPAVGTLMNLAECEERIGRRASAWQRWGAALEQLPRDDRRRALATRRIAALEKTVARLTIVVAPGAPPGLQIRRDGVLVGAGSLGSPLPIDPGRHVITVVAPGGQPPRDLEVDIDEGEQCTLKVDTDLFAVAASGSEASMAAPPPFVPISPGAPLAVAPALPAPGPRPVAAAPGLTLTTTPEPAAATGRPWLGYALLGTGAALIGAGGYMALLTVAARRDAAADCVHITGINRCWSNAAGALARERRYSLLADAGFAAGALAAGTGLYLLLFRGSGGASERVTAGVVPRAAGGEVQVAGTF